MKSSIFPNSGRGIKIVSVIFFWLGVILSVAAALGFVFGYLGQEMDDFSKLAWAIGLFVGGILLSYLIALFLHGYGELIENSRKSAEYTREIVKACERLESSTEKLDALAEGLDRFNATVKQGETDEVLIRMNKIHQLYEKGILTEEEFTLAKEEIIKKM